MKWLSWSMVLCIICIVAIAGCSKAENDTPLSPVTSGEGETQAASPTNDPVSLKVFSALGNYNHADKFNEEIARYVKDKYPHITLDLQLAGQGTQIQDLITAGTVPDMLLTGSGSLRSLLEQNGLQFDLAESIRKHNFPLQNIDPVLIEMAQNALSSPGIWGLPFQLNVFVTFYNQELFDKFGVAYPQNGMTWDNLYDLARQMTRTDGETAYRGLSSYYLGALLLNNQLSLSALDAKANKAAINNDKFVQLFQNLGRFYHIPGNRMADSGEPAAFDKGGVALSPHTSEKYTQYERNNSELKWDMVSYPTFAEQPGIGAQPNPFYMTITNTSKQKEAAFQVIAHLLSEEVQLQWAKEGRIPVLKSSNLEQQFGAEQPLLSGKNTSAFFYNRFASPPSARDAGLVNVAPNRFIDEAFVSTVKQGVDINTALRAADEKLNQAIHAELAK